MGSFGEILEELRQDKNLSQKELGDVLHVTAGTISNYENDVHLPSSEKLVDLADFFDVTIDYLLRRCSSSLSPDVWNQVIVDQYTAGELIQTILHMSLERRRALLLIINDMNLSTTIDQVQKKEVL